MVDIFRFKVISVCTAIIHNLNEFNLHIDESMAECSLELNWFTNDYDSHYNDQMLCTHLGEPEDDCQLPFLMGELYNLS